EHGEAEGLYVVPFSAWSAEDPVAEVRAAVGGSEGSVADAIVSWGSRTGGLLLLVLDQFEEYFLYHGDKPWAGSFAAELAEALRRRDTPVNVLLSIREDSLALLDRFEGRVPGLLDNLIRIDHLDRVGARAAIERPLERWHELGNDPVEIE